MDTIKRQVRQAHRRLFWNNLTYSVTWSTFIAFLIALVAIVIPKIWPLGLTDGRVWSIVWLCGAAVVGITGGVVWTLFHRRDELDAAIEIDLRYGLKERVSMPLRYRLKSGNRKLVRRCCRTPRTEYRVLMCASIFNLNSVGIRCCRL